MPARAVIAHQLGTARVVGRRIADVGPGCRIDLPARTADEEAAVQQDEAGAGRQEDVTREVDGAEHAGGFPATHRQATEIVMFDPPGHTARVAEVGVNVVLVEGWDTDVASR